MSLRACNKQTIEDAENLEIAKSMQAGDQKQKYDMEWPYRPQRERGRACNCCIVPYT